MGARMQREKHPKSPEQPQNKRKIPDISTPPRETKASGDGHTHHEESKAVVKKNHQVTKTLSSNMEVDDDNLFSSSPSAELIKQFSKELNCKVDSMSDIPSIPSSSKHPYVFHWEGEGKQVYVSGSYDNWTTRTLLTRSRTSQFTIIDVPMGMHQYKFLVDGEWKLDPNIIVVTSDCGTKNNVLNYEKNDCNVLEALLADDYDEDKEIRPSKWSQYIPPLVTSGTGFLRKGPPALPPYIGNSVLNLQLASQNDPNLLPEPQQVTLNHLYTSSIKDVFAFDQLTLRKTLADYKQKCCEIKQRQKFANKLAE